MAALVTGPGPVRDLVAVEAGCPESLDRVLVGDRRPFVVLIGSGALAPAPGARASRQVVAERSGQSLGIRVVERQGIGRYVVGSEADRGRECPLPGRSELAGHVIEQVERDRPDARPPRFRDRLIDVRGAVATTEAPQLVRVERLRTDREAGDARLAPVACPPRSSGPGFTSSVTSAPGVRPNRLRIRSMSAATSTAGRSDGVPPPR